jgi:hypothetical protein
VPGGDLVFVGGEGCQDFGLLALRDLKKSRVRPSSAATSSNSARGDPEVVVDLLAERCRAGLGGRELEGATRNVADPQRMNLRPGSLPWFLVCHSRSCAFLDFCPTMGFFTTASLK